jgi:phage-related baseplate assembly protein
MTINANRFIAPTINILDLPRPDAIEELDAETILADRMTQFQSLADAAGFPYDVGGLETDPIKIDQEAHALRELLMRSRVNSAVRAVLPAYAQGADLDAIAARANVRREIVTPADEQAGTPAVYEGDDKLLVRYLASFAAPSAGSPDAYIYWAATTVPALRDVAVLGPSVHGVAGKVEVRLLWEGGGATPDDIVEKVRKALAATNVKPLTDWLIVSAAPVVRYSVDMVVRVPLGPAPATVAAAVKANVRKAADARYAIDAPVWLNFLEGAGYVANVAQVIMRGPAASIQPEPGGAAYCEDIAVTVEVV